MNSLTTPSISDLSAKNFNVNAGTIAFGDVATFLALTTGTVTATVAPTTLANLSAVTTITETGHALALNITDATVDAAALKAVNAKTTGKITLHSDVTKVNGTAADVLEAFDKSLAGTEMTKDRLQRRSCNRSFIFNNQQITNEFCSVTCKSFTVYVLR